jgi:hypothetical protein
VAVSEIDAGSVVCGVAVRYDVRYGAVLMPMFAGLPRPEDCVSAAMRGVVVPVESIAAYSTSPAALGVYGVSSVGSVGPAVANAVVWSGDSPSLVPAAL